MIRIDEWDFPSHRCLRFGAWQEPVFKSLDSFRFYLSLHPSCILSLECSSFFILIRPNFHSIKNYSKVLINISPRETFIVILLWLLSWKFVTLHIMTFISNLLIYIKLSKDLWLLCTILPIFGKERQSFYLS